MAAAEDSRILNSSQLCESEPLANRGELTSSPVERQPGEGGCCPFRSGAISEYVVFTSLSVFYQMGKARRRIREMGGRLKILQSRDANHVRAEAAGNQNLRVLLVLALAAARRSQGCVRGEACQWNWADYLRRSHSFGKDREKRERNLVG